MLSFHYFTSMHGKNLESFVFQNSHKENLKTEKRENWNIFQNIGKMSNTPQGSVFFLEWTKGDIAKVRRSPAKRTKLVLLETPPSPQNEQKFALQA